MEPSEQLSIESFSYSWLANLQPSFESPKGSLRSSFDAFDETNFIEMDPKLSASKRFLVVHQDFDFDFDLPALELEPRVHADELISNGILIPLFLKPLDAESYDSSSYSAPATPASSSTRENARSSSLRKYYRFPKGITHKYLDLVRQIWVRMRGGKSDAARERRAKNWECSNTSSPRISEACSADNWRRSCDSESSILEAVLHCKKTIGCK